MSRTVLLLEDEAELLDLFGQLVEGWGYEVLPAAEPAEARRYAGEEPRIDVLLADLGSLRGAGDLLAELHAAHPELRPVYMSGHTAGFDPPDPGWGTAPAFLQKPFPIDDLEAALAAAVGRAG